MTKKTKMYQVYGYIVCIIAVITFLTSLAGLINSVIDSSDPLYTWGNTNNLSSYENFKADLMKSTKSDADFIQDDATLKQMFEDAKDYKIRQVKHQTKKSMIVSSILIVLSIVLFLVHWRWMKRIDKIEEKLE